MRFKMLYYKEKTEKKTQFNEQAKQMKQDTITRIVLINRTDHQDMYVFFNEKIYDDGRIFKFNYLHLLL